MGIATTTNTTRQPIISISVRLVDIDSVLAANNVILNINDVHLAHRNNCPNKMNSVNFLSKFKSNFNFVHLKAQGILDAHHLAKQYK